MLLLLLTWLLLTLLLCSLGYFGYRLSVTLTIAVLFFYHGWHNEAARNRKLHKLMQREFEDVLEYKHLKNIPAWFVYPDVERANWLNEFLQKLWPQMNRAIGQSIKDSVQPLLDYYKPGFLSHLAFDKLNMGDKAFRVTGMKRPYHPVS